MAVHGLVADPSGRIRVLRTSTKALNALKILRNELRMTSDSGLPVLLAYVDRPQRDAPDRGDRQPLDAGLRADDTRWIPKDDLDRVLQDQALGLDVEIGADVLDRFRLWPGR